VFVINLRTRFYVPSYGISPVIAIMPSDKDTSE